MSPSAQRESRPVFQHIVGQDKRVVAFDRIGLAELAFRIRSGRHAGLHTIWIELHLLRVRSVSRSRARRR